VSLEGRVHLAPASIGPIADTAQDDYLRRGDSTPLLERGFPRPIQGAIALERPELFVRCTHLSCDRQRPRGHNLIPRCTRPAPVLTNRRVRPMPQPIERLDVAAVGADLDLASRH
jgi:hypothetical protein